MKLYILKINLLLGVNVLITQKLRNIYNCLDIYNLKLRPLQYNFLFVGHHIKKGGAGERLNTIIKFFFFVKIVIYLKFELIGFWGFFSEK